MDFEKEYKAALERAKQKRDEYIRLDNDNAVPQDIEFIFPELRESEDEKIRKELVQFFQDIELCYMNKEEILSWLEKQGEQKPVEWSIDDAKCGDVLAYPDGTLAVFNYRLDGLDAGLYMAYLVCSSSEIKYKQTCAIHNATKATKEQIEILFNNLGKSVEWSEEEENELLAIIEDLEKLRNDSRLIDTKSIYQKEIEFLKSLKPQPHWKPSEEQMEALRFAKNDYVLGDIKSNLEQLYNELKKL